VGLTLLRGRTRVFGLVAAAAIVVSACGGGATTAPGSASPAPASAGPSAAPSASAPPAAATLDVWLGGILTTATAGTPYETWVNNVIKRFKDANPGSDVKITLLPSNNDQLAAQVQAAFASKKVPDVMMLYSGAYTTAYEGGLRRINDYVQATPGMWDGMILWDGACVGFDCNGGQGEIVGVPVESYQFMLWYRTDLLEKAGIAGPPKTMDELYAQCDKLNAAGITPMVYGDRDGYTSSNMMTTNITSYFNEGDAQKLAAGEMKYTDQKLVDALKPIIALKDHKCVPADASTREQLDAANDIVTGKAAYMEGQPQFYPYFKDITDKLGVALIPYSGTGPLSTKNSSFSGDNWVIPKDAVHPELAWEFIKLASDEIAGAEMVTALGAPPANKAAAAKITDPFIKYIAEQTQNYGMPILDSVMPNPVALVWYRELQQAFAGAKTPEEALAAIQAAQDQQGP
jgi:raffinose/stachyose/melibiose transport system substrate-binding protein